MLALEPRVADAGGQRWSCSCRATNRSGTPLGCHRRQLCDRGVFEPILFRLVIGCFWNRAALDRAEKVKGWADVFPETRDRGQIRGVNRLGRVCFCP